MSTLLTTVDPLTAPVVPSDVAVAVAVVSDVSEVDEPEMSPIPTSEDDEASGLPDVDGASVPRIDPRAPASAPAVGASSPMVAVAVLSLVFDTESMFRPGSSTEV